MKKFLLLVVASLFVTGAFAQDWSVGARAGSGFQAVGQYSFNQKNYVEARFGLNLVPGAAADLTGLYNWRLLQWDWTPEAGTWFLDAGVGASVGGAKQYAYFGATGMARFGFKFRKVPISLSIDYSPVIGLDFLYGPGGGADYNGGEAGYAPVETRAAANKRTYVGFHEAGLWNSGITFTYTF
jgi:hypothetical protein